MSIACMYRGPRATHSENQQTIQALNNLARNSTGLVIMGDFNLSKDAELKAILSGGCIHCQHIAGRNLDARLAVVIIGPVQPDLTWLENQELQKNGHK
ncbi:unnamed protein product [Echinostoma caproni]|uniref:Endo/exonuclease/phosphatase domain-containing protein n=1 Tax=Echinostoma caproni TaxID=27848 RepID=A0A183BG52_9TREM|nr:unnamed protein product [Echinostoma caproni]